MTEYNQAEVTAKVAAGLAKMRRLLPVNLIALLEPRAGEGPAGSNGINLLVLYRGRARANAADLVKEALDINSVEPRAYSTEEYSQSKSSVDALIAKGIVLFQEGSSDRRSQPMRRGWRTSLRWIGNGLISAGLLFMLTTGVYYAYSYYSLGQMEQEAEPEEVASLIQEISEETPATAPSTEESSALVSFLAGGADGAKAAVPSASTIGDEVPWEGLSFWPLGIFPPSRIIIPSINVDSKIIETGIVFEEGEWQWERPKNAVGHLKGTGDPGQPGNMVLSGHISSPQRGEGEVFKRLPDIKVGDVVIVYTQARAFTYQVMSKKVVLPNDVSVLKPATDEAVTLITCVPDFIYSHRLIVTAKRVAST